jgi:hypothetical protein
MVRLVFRPYAQMRRTICTSVPLRASTRVSSGFALFRHSSPSFGSQHPCSCADPAPRAGTGRCCPARVAPLTFIPRLGLPPKHSHACWTPWSVFQDGSLKAISPASWVHLCAERAVRARNRPPASADRPRARRPTRAMHAPPSSVSARDQAQA